MRKGFHLVSDEELIHGHFDPEVDFRRDPDGLLAAVGERLNELLSEEPVMREWSWALDRQALPGAISVAVTGTAKDQLAWDCPAFFAATSVAVHAEVEDAAQRLAYRILRTVRAWQR